jgi:hypothetical protein
VTVGSSHASPVDRDVDHWRGAVGSPDIPVNFSRSALGDSREQRVHRRATCAGGAPLVVSVELLLLL